MAQVIFNELFHFWNDHARETIESDSNLRVRNVGERFLGAERDCRPNLLWLVEVNFEYD